MCDIQIFDGNFGGLIVVLITEMCFNLHAHKYFFPDNKVSNPQNKIER